MQRCVGAARRAVLGVFRGVLAGPILVALDLLADPSLALARVASLPRGGATLHLVHVVSSSLREAERAEAVRSRRAQLASLAEEAKLGAVEVHVDPGAPAERIGALAAELDASLVVLGHGATRVRDHFIGSTAERVLRATRRPVLVVRRVAGAYRAPMLALDLDEVAPRALRVVLDVLAPPRPELGIVHAYDVPYFTLSHSDLRSPEALAHRRGLRDVARDALSRVLVETLTARALTNDDDDTPVSWRLHLRHGSPRHQILRVARAKRADLLVVGTRGRGGLSFAFLGSVAGDVLRESPCDVLLVPPAS